MALFYVQLLLLVVLLDMWVALWVPFLRTVDRVFERSNFLQKRWQFNLFTNYESELPFFFDKKFMREEIYER